MTVELRAVGSSNGDTAVHAVLVAKGQLDHPALDAAALGRLGFEGAAGSSHVFPGANGALLAVVGLGEADDVDAAAVRRAGAVLARALVKQEAVAVDLPSVDGVEPTAVAQALGEGLSLASYSYDRFKSDPEPSKLARADVVAGDRTDAVTDGL